MRLSIKTIPTALAASAVLSLAVAGAAEAKVIRGTVVHTNHHAHSFTVAASHGKLTAIHASHSPAIGRRVAVKVRKLRNGTFAALRIHKLGVRRHVTLRGTVTYVGQGGHAFVLSARGVSLVVNRHHRPGMRAADAAPGVGTDVTVSGDVTDQGEIDETSVSNDGENQGPAELEGRILAVDQAARTLTISADDEDQSGSQITVDLPAGFDMSLYQVGDEVQLRATPNADGSFTAVATSSDGNGGDANRGSDQQGDEGDHHGDPSVADATAACQQEMNDPNFPATHDGKTFSEFYAPEDTMSSFGKCVDENSHGQSHDSGGQSGSSGDQSGSTSDSSGSGD